MHEYIYMCPNITPDMPHMSPICTPLIKVYCDVFIFVFSFIPLICLNWACMPIIYPNCDSNTPMISQYALIYSHVFKTYSTRHDRKNAKSTQVMSKPKV